MAAILDPPFLIFKISKIRRQIRNQHPQKPFIQVYKIINKKKKICRRILRVSFRRLFLLRVSFRHHSLLRVSFRQFLFCAIVFAFSFTIRVSLLMPRRYVTTVPKKGDEQNVANYCSIVKNFIFGKMLDSINEARFSEYMRKYAVDLSRI